jgi:arginyl-tRNA synthetase
MDKIIKELITTALKKVLDSKIELDESAWIVERPTDLSHGDWTSNVAMKLFGQLKANAKEGDDFKFGSARELAMAIAEDIENQKSNLKDGNIEKIEVAGPGFINFSVSDKFYTAKMTDMLGKGATMIPQTKKGQKIIVEFTDPNPFKEFHIGHVYSNCVGEAISRLYEAVGATVQRACYQGDVGMHVAKSIWGVLSKLSTDFPEAKDWKQALDELGHQPLSKRIQFLGQAYALGATAYKDDEQAKKDIATINYYTYLAGQDQLVEAENWQPQVDYKQLIQDTALDYEQIKTLYQTGRAWSLDYFESIYQRLGTKFDEYYFESLMGEYGLKLVKEYLGKGVFEESQGAVIFPGKKHGLHDRVFINSVGLPTYEAKELGLAPEKYKRFPYDKSLVITGNEIDEYFKVLLKALSIIQPELASKTVHLSHAMVRLPEGKMSSRTGKIITGEWLLNEAKARSLAKIKEIKTDKSGKATPEIIDAKSMDNISEVVGLAAVKYSLLKSSIGQDIAFSFDESLSFQGNSGPYLLYSYVRTQSIWSKLAGSVDLEEYITKSIDTLLNNKAYLKHKLEIDEKLTLRYIAVYIDAVNEAVRTHSPHVLAGAVFNLATAFNTFYAHHQVVSGELKDLSQIDPATAWRLLLTRAVGLTIKHGLNVLGIPVVDKM